jgi:hypothetical protein
MAEANQQTIRVRLPPFNLSQTRQRDARIALNDATKCDQTKYEMTP